MEIGFDAKRAFHNRSGLGNYSRNAITALSRFYPKNHYFLYTPSTSDLFLWNNLPGLSAISPRGLWKIFHPLWRSSAIITDLKNNNVKLYHGLSNELPRGLKKSGIKSVVTIHDLIFLRYPEFYPAADRYIYHRKSLHACSEADHIIAVSEQTKTDLMNFYKIPDEKISVICQSVSSRFYQRATEQQQLNVKEKFTLPKEFILCVGTIEKRKNLLAVLKAIDRMDSKYRLPLIIIGKATSYKKQADQFIKQHRLADHVQYLSNVLNEDMPFIYQAATLLAYPSENEGFGLPLAEALASGLPVVCNDLKVFREAAGPFSLYVDANNPEGFAAAILSVMNDDELQKSMAAEGRLYSTKFRAVVQASQLEILYQKLLTE